MWRHTTKLYGTAQKNACLFWLVFLLDDAKQVKSVNPICWRITHPSILAISHWLKGFSSWLNSNHKTIERGTCTHKAFSILHSTAQTKSPVPLTSYLNARWAARNNHSRHFVESLPWLFQALQHTAHENSFNFSKFVWYYPIYIKLHELMIVCTSNWTCNVEECKYATIVIVINYN